MAYIGNKFIQSSAESMDGKSVGVLYVDQTSEMLPTWEFNAIKTELPTDETEVRVLRVSALVKEILQLLTERDARWTDMTFLCQRIMESCEMNQRRLLDKLYGDERKNWRFGKIDEMLTDASGEAGKMV